jgi:drug/metabolite transporter (DMT)-like permease
VTAARPRTAALVAAFASVYLFWGGTFLALRYLVAEVPPLTAIALRCAGGAAVLYLWIWARGHPTRMSAAEWRTAATAGLLLFVGCHGLLAWAEQRVSSGQAALLMASTPLWLVVVDTFRTGRPFSLRALAAVALGIGGVLLLTWGGAWSGGPGELGALLFGAFAWAVGSLVARDGDRPAGAALGTAAQLAAGAVWVLLAAVVAGETSRWTPGAISTRGALSLAFLIVCGTALGFGAYVWLLRTTSPLAAGTYAFVNPIVALLVGWAAGDDQLTPRVAVAAVLAVAAVVAAMRR